MARGSEPLNTLGQSMDAQVARADRAMYQAKQLGRNRVVKFELAPAGAPAA